VNPQPQPSEPGNIRASDADRHQVAEILRDAAGDGRLTLDELQERLDQVFAARTYAELQALTSDLPVAGAPLPSVAASPMPERRVGPGTPGQSVSIAVMSGSVKRGGWVVPSAHTAVAFMGGVQLDLRDARLTHAETTIRAFAVMGGIEIIVPHDVAVIVEGVGIMGGFDDSVGYTEPRPGQPVIRVTGLAFWGGVEVKRPKRKSKNDQRAIEN
jgi:hypothetical protein